MHVGLPKCGSTSIQLRLASNRAQLLRHGIHYPPALGMEGEESGHMALSASLATAKTVSPLLLHALDGFRTSGASVLCLSSEAFITRAPTFDRAGVGSELQDFETSILALYRRHDAWVTSRYKQAVIGKAYTATLPEFVTEPPPGYKGMVDFDIAARLDRLTTVFGAERMTVIDLDGEGADAVAAMGDLLDIPLADWPADPTLLKEQKSLRVQNGTANISLGNLATLFLRDVNALRPRKELREAVVLALVKSARPEPPTRIMRKPMAERLLATFVRENRRLFERFGLSPHSQTASGTGPFRRELEPEEVRSVRADVIDAIAPGYAREAEALLAQLG
jgi:hypothetical protein